MLPEIGNVFSKLSKYPIEVTPGDKEALERFVTAMYDRSSSAADVHAARLDMFARKQRQYDAIPPTSLDCSITVAEQSLESALG
ncbi:hypothetical protein DPMN_173907 [Dreissena polymorpha]|uniref:Uncharacterized protein n=1 Tax=Dreissena polymorpha TaxID=45954 RepID=A0A9D4IEM9_DREPO|nr:hypothetical protein DPMN_173907 [Dreissena polymorpha]